MNINWAASLANWGMGVALIVLVYWALRGCASRRMALVWTCLIFWLGSFANDSSHPGWVLRYFLPNFQLYRYGVSSELPTDLLLQCLMIGASHLLLWAGFLWYLRKLCAGEEKGS